LFIDEERKMLAQEMLANNVDGVESTLWLFLYAQLFHSSLPKTQECGF